MTWELCPWPAARNGVSSDLFNRAYPTTAKTQATKSPNTQRLRKVANPTGSGISSFLGYSKNMIIIDLRPALFHLCLFESFTGGLQVVARNLPAPLEFGIELIQLDLLLRRQLGLDLRHPVGQGLLDFRLMRKTQP